MMISFYFTIPKFDVSPEDIYNVKNINRHCSKLSWKRNFPTKKPLQKLI
jgi:hypothetical protein